MFATLKIKYDSLKKKVLFISTCRRVLHFCLKFPSSNFNMQPVCQAPPNNATFKQTADQSFPAGL